MDFSPDRPAFFVNPDYPPDGRRAARRSIDPATLETVGAIAAATDAEIDAALDRRDRGAGRVEAARRQEPREAPARRGERHRGGRLRRGAPS